ncbi:MAG: rhomboid family intramembrane serine protease [Pseudomonadota bacterium]
MSDTPPPSPFNPLPPVVVALSLVIFGVEVVLSLGARGIIGGPGAVGWRTAAIQDYAFFGEIFRLMLASGQFPAEYIIRFFSYPFVHLSFTQMIFVLVFLLALGNMVGRIFPAWAVVVIFFVSAAVGALAYGLLIESSYPLVGGFPAVYGLIGAYSFILWVGYGAVGENQYRAFTLIGMLVGIQLFFAALFGGTGDWVADIGGFIAGFLLSFILVPGGWQRLIDKIRQR